MNWPEFEIPYLISELPDRAALFLANKKISLDKTTLQIRLDTTEEAIAARDLIHAEIARLVRSNPGQYAIDHVAYIWHGGKFKIPLVLPSLKRQATSA